MSKDTQAPPQTDYRAAAQAQGAANVDTARTQGVINNPNVNTPYGSQRVSYDRPEGYTGDVTPTITQTLNPAQQGLLDSQNAISQGLLNTGQTALTRAQDSLSKPMEMGSVGDIYDKAYGAQTARLDPRFAREQNSLETQLTNQGLRPGSEAWSNAMTDFNQGKNDAYQQATNSAIGTMPQTYQLATAQRTQPLNEVNSLRTGTQVQNPQFQGYNPAQIGQTPLMQAAGLQGQEANNAYSNQVAANNSNTQGLYSLGGTAAMAFAI